MSDLTAQFELTLIDQISAPLRHVQESLRSLDRSLSAINSSGGAVHQTTKHIAETVDSVTTSSRNAYDSLFNLGSVSDEMKQAVYGGAGSLKDVQEKAASGGGALAEMNSHAGRSIGIMSQLHTQLGHVGNGLGRVVSASKGFHESVEKSMGRAFGAAAAGFGLIEPGEKAAEFDSPIMHAGIAMRKQGQELFDFVNQEKLFLNQTARAYSQQGTGLAEAEFFLSSEGYKGERLRAVLPTIAKVSTGEYVKNPEDTARTAFALHENYKIKDGKELDNAFAAMASAGTLAHIPFDELAQYFPELATGAAGLGIKGLSGLKDTMAMLAVTRKSSGSLQKAVTDTRQFFTDLNQQTATRQLAKYHIDSFALQQDALAHHRNPALAVIDAVRKVAVKTDGSLNAKVVGDLFHNAEAKNFAQAVLMHPDELHGIRATLEKADGKQLDTDFKSAQQDPLAQLRTFHEALNQMIRHIGDHFVPILAAITPVINAINSAFEWLDKTAPGVTTVVVGIVGGLLAFAAAVSAIGAIMGPITAGFALVTSLGGPLMAVFSGLGAVIAAIGWPITLAIAGVVALGVVIYEMWKHWDKVSAFIKAAEDAITSFFGHIFKHLLPSSLYQTMAQSQHHHPYAQAAAPVPPQHGPVALPHAATPAQPPVTIHVRHDKDLHVTADPHPHHMVHAMPHGGAMVGRP